MADTGHRAEAQHHLLVDVKHRDQQQQGPQQGGTVVLAGLAVGAEGAGIVVADHDDQAGADDRHQRAEPCLPGDALPDVTLIDGAEGALDVADMGGIENGMTGGIVENAGVESKVGHSGLSA
jgi:hypothetical protein